MSDSEIVPCPACGAKNRVASDRLSGGAIPVCGRCKAPLPAPAPDAGVPVIVTDTTFAEVVERSPVPVLVDLWAPWCGPCRMLAPTLDRIAADMAGRVRVAKVNVDENPGLANRFQARSIPLMVILKDGQEVDRMVGVQPPAEINRRLAQFT